MNQPWIYMYSPSLVIWITGLWCLSVLGQLSIESSCPSQGKACSCQEGSPSCLLQLITQLCACWTFGWICTWGFLARNPAPFSLNWSGAYFVSLCCVCVCVCVCECKHLSKLSWVGVRLVLYDCNWEWIYRSEWRDCGCVTPHTSPVDNSDQCSRVHVPKLCSQIPGFKTSLPTQLL